MSDEVPAGPGEEAPPRKPRSRLFRKYALMFGALVALALAASAAVEVYFSYFEAKAALLRIQREKAESAATVIEQFVKEVEAQIGWTTHAAFAASADSLAQRRIDFLRLLRQAPAVTEIGYLDATGHEQVLVSRLAMDVVGSNKDYSADPKFVEARAEGRYLSPVYFRKESEPYLTLALAGRGRDKGVTVAEVNLKFIWDVISRIRVGRAGRAYVVDAKGLLIAHPDISLVLRKTDLASRPQVMAARAHTEAGPAGDEGGIARDLSGREVLSAHAAIAPLGWLVFVESPLSEAFRPIYDSLERTAVLLVAGIALSVLAGLLLARRMVRPIRALAAGAAEIGAGALGRRIEVETGDELEDLADRFNDMGARLRESYATLERRVEVRTRELTESLEQQTATSEILRVIASTPSEPGRALDTIAQTAQRLLGASAASITRVEEGGVRRVAAAGLAAQVPALLGQPLDRGSPSGRAALEKRTIHVENIQQQTGEFPTAPGVLGQIDARAVLATPLMRETQAIGAITVLRTEARPFTDKQIALIESFASQAAIAIENARLLEELNARMRDLAESLDQQTATSEVLRVIASSPGEAERVLGTIIATAQRLFGCSNTVVSRVENGAFRQVAAAGTEAAVASDLISGRRVDDQTLSGRAVMEKRTLHVPDAEDSPYELVPGPDGPLHHVSGNRTLLATPLMREGEAIGAITLRKELRPFTEKEIALVESFADQAVIAIENARLLSELRESLDRQTGTAEVLRTIAASPAEAERALDTIARVAARLFDASDVNIHRLEGGVLHFAASFGEIASEIREKFPTRPLDPSSIPAAAILERRPLAIADYSAPDVRARFPAARALGKPGSLVATPMMREGEAIGAIVVVRDGVRPFTETERAQLENFADQAVIAIENARLLDELQDRGRELADSVEELKALASVGQAVSASLELQTVLDAIARHAAELAGGNASAIYAFDEATATLELEAAHNMRGEVVERITRMPIHLGEGAVGQAAQRKAPVQYPDLEEARDFALRDLSMRAGFRALLAVPMLREGRIIGGITVTRETPGAFPDRTVELLQSFATQSALAIQNARLFREIEEQGRELALASQHKSQFLANMSHELRTPLNAILGYTELILDDIYGPPSDKVREVIDRVQANGRHLLGLINDVLDLSKIEAGQLALSVDDYAMGDVVHTVVTATEALAAEDGLEIAVAVPPDLPAATGDQRRIAQVLLNLVGNAIKFTEAGEVGIAVTTRDSELVVAVSDTGTGIAPDDQARIFDEFQQVDSSNTKTKGGTGLGLAIAKRIVEMHGGRIWVESVPGEGSTFRFALPLHVAQAEVTP